MLVHCQGGRKKIYPLWPQKKIRSKKEEVRCKNGDVSGQGRKLSAIGLAHAFLARKYLPTRCRCLKQGKRMRREKKGES